MNEWISEPLRSDHGVEYFRCGNQALGNWLPQYALRAQPSGTARSYVWTRSDDVSVKAYYAITPTQVRRQEVPRAMAGGVGIVPGYLLARLALDGSLHSRGLGSELLIDALQVIVAAAETAGGRLTVVDAIDDKAAAFYRHHDFVPIAGERRLVMRVATARAVVGA